MIISASRRTDIPAFFSKWFLQRIRAGYCTVVNPMNKNQVSYVPLHPEDVSAIVFWTKNALPLLSSLEELNDKGYRYFFQYTINGYPHSIEKHVPNLQNSLDTFIELSRLIGPDRVIWRYDPILISNITDFNYHKENFRNISRTLKGKTKRVAVSIVDNYRKAQYNFKDLQKSGVIVRPINEGPDFSELMPWISNCAKENGMAIYSCAESIDLRPYGINPGKCIDNSYLKEVFGLDISYKKDKSQRLECGCIQSKDIGSYDTCLHGCAYCYAGTILTAKRNYGNHYSNSPSIMGRHEATKEMKIKEKKVIEKENYEQIDFFKGGPI